MTRPHLVLALHGTAKPAGQQVAAELLLAVATRLPGVTVHLGWADVLTPTLTDTLSSLGNAIVVPCFLTAGYHVNSDLPAAIRASGGRARLTPVLGPSLLDAVIARLEEAGGPGDAVVLAAAGSRREASNTQVALAATDLGRRLGRPTAPAYLTAAAPTPAEAVAGLRAAGHTTVSIASYLLAPGVFADRLHAAGANLVSAPVGVHPLVVGGIVDRYRKAVTHGVGLPDARERINPKEAIA
ncbi:MAG: CbiX/SirB N-terminal domain-containing protein [Propionicimonas sp.]